MKASQVEAFERSLARLLEDAQAAPGCRWAYALRAEDITPSYLVLSGWEDSASMRAWEESPRHRRAANVGEEAWFSQPLVVRRYRTFSPR
ncbi:MAG: antibiotic biosynthesis monooxygenase [Chloroflexi bacterium]|nr:antibiotic biosynthesis monooxygenase [Chloroflexota bacterium]